MFRGPSKVTLDAKGRLAIPSRFRERILSRGEGHLVATVDREHCLLIYPLPDWEEIERKLIRLSSVDPVSQKLKRVMLGNAMEMEMDGHGRILVPRELREFASLDKQAMLVGQGNKFELWDEQRWSKRREEWLAIPESEYEHLADELKNLSF
jgi:transcriptional regulator MraZ